MLSSILLMTMLAANVVTCRSVCQEVFVLRASLRAHLNLSSWLLQRVQVALVEDFGLRDAWLRGDDVNAALCAQIARAPGSTMRLGYNPAYSGIRSLLTGKRSCSDSFYDWVNRTCTRS